MLTLVRVTTATHRAQFRALLLELTRAGLELMEQELGTGRLDVDAFVARDMAHLEQYDPPDGCLLLACDDGEPAGCVGMRRIGPDAAELKRMWVRPAHRRKGIGRALTLAVVEEARCRGYRLLRLDSPPFYQAAHALYRSVGFRDRPPYAESEVPERLRDRWGVFMEMELDVRRGG